MIDEQWKKIEDLMTKIIEEIDKTHLRKIQGDMHRCAAVCCNNESYSVQKVHKCVESCSVPLNKAQRYVQREFDRLQNRLQRCVSECNDQIKDKMESNFVKTDMSIFNDEFENCATKCVDTYCDLLSAFESSIKNVLASNAFSNQ